MIYWATTVTGKFPETQSTAESAYNHRLYYTTTKDFKSFTETKLLYEPGFNSIDATIVKDAGRYIMFLKDETPTPPQKNLKIAYSETLTGPYTKAGEPITGRYWAEGPTTLKTAGKWLVFFDKYTEHKYGAVMSADLKTWTDVSDQISMPPGIRHGSIFRVTAEEFAKLK